MQRERVPSLKELLRPTVRTRLYATSERGGWTHYASKIEEPPFPLDAPQPVDARDWAPEGQALYVKLAAMDGDWRAMRGTKPTEEMRRLFISARAAYLERRR